MHGIQLTAQTPVRTRRHSGKLIQLPGHYIG